MHYTGGTMKHTISTFLHRSLNILSAFVLITSLTYIMFYKSETNKRSNTQHLDFVITSHEITSGVFNANQQPEPDIHTYTGYFSTKVNSGESIILRPNCLRIKLYKNGALLLDNKLKEKNSRLKYLAGGSYQLYNIGDITPSDVITIKVQKAYSFYSDSLITDFFNQMYYARDAAVYRSILKYELFGSFGGCVLILSGLLILYLSIYDHRLNGGHLRNMKFLGYFCMTSGGKYLCNASRHFIDLLIPNSTLNTLIDVLTFPLLIISLMFLLITTAQNKKNKQTLRRFVLVFVCYEIILSILHALELIRVFHSNISFILITEFTLVSMYVILFKEWMQTRNNELLKITCASLPLFFALSIKFLIFLLYRRENRVLVQLGLLISSYLLLQDALWYFKKTLARIESEERLKQELQDAHISIMLSQIQPHFMYNTLNTLQYLCKKDSDLAAEAIERFSRYLRGNMQSLTTSHLIPFKQELEHVEHYIYIERLRFGERIQIVYDIEYTDFLLPTLTLQPIVENAIRHGITKKANGGIVKITVRKVLQGILIMIEDNGIGFQVSNIDLNTPRHIGIMNVKRRLELQCNGTIAFESDKMTGTKVTILLKGTTQNNECNDC